MDLAYDRRKSKQHVVETQQFGVLADTCKALPPHSRVDLLWH